jgi:hypothetical protein
MRASGSALRFASPTRLREKPVFPTGTLKKVLAGSAETFRDLLLGAVSKRPDEVDVRQVTPKRGLEGLDEVRVDRPEFLDSLGQAAEGVSGKGRRSRTSKRLDTEKSHGQLVTRGALEGEEAGGVIESPRGIREPPPFQEGSGEVRPDESVDGGPRFTAHRTQSPRVLAARFFEPSESQQASPKPVQGRDIGVPPFMAREDRKDPLELFHGLGITPEIRQGDSLCSSGFRRLVLEAQGLKRETCAPGEVVCFGGAVQERPPLRLDELDRR